MLRKNYSARQRRVSPSKVIPPECSEFEKLLSAVAKAFNDAAPDQFARVMNGNLELLASVLGFERASILLLGQDRNKLALAYSSMSEDLLPIQIGSNIGDDLPWYAGHVRRGHMIRLERLSDLPAEAVREREYLMQQGLNSSLSIPLISGGDPIGAVLLGSSHVGQRWEPELMLRFRLIGEILTLALKKNRASCLLESIAEGKDSECRAEAFQTDNAHLRKLALHLIKVERDERRRMAEVLHERVMQTLAAVGFMMSSQQEVSSGNSEELNRANELIHSAIDDLRALVSDLHPPSPYGQELGPSLHMLADQVNRAHGMKVEVHLGSIETPPSEDLSLLVYEAVRQLLTNAAVHGRASNATVELSGIQAGYRLTVSDNGSGFNKAVLDQNPFKAFGLFALREKIQLYGGSFEIESSVGQGTRATVTLPFGDKTGETPACGRD